MEYLLQLFTSLTGDSTGTASFLLSIALGTAAALFTLAVMLVAIGVFDPLKRRLRTVTGNTTTAGGNNTFSRFVEPLESVSLPKNKKETEKMSLRLIQAGFRSSQAITTFYGIKMILGIGLGGLVFIFASLYPQFSTFQVVGFSLFVAFIGLIIPNAYVNRHLEKRQKLIIRAFPDALDLLVACSEAGLGLSSAIQRVAHEININHPVLSEELELVNSEMRAGVSRDEALRNLYRRTGVNEIRGLVSLLSQSVRFGTSIADTLRVYSEEFRDKRLQKAEEQAAKVGVKMIFPIVFFLLPSFFVIAMGPAILGVIRELSGKF